MTGFAKGDVVRHLADPHGRARGTVEPFITHLYPSEGNTWTTFCGLNVKDDPHAMMHKGYGQKSPRWERAEGPGEGCPVCGAPICSECARRI